MKKVTTLVLSLFLLLSLVACSASTTPSESATSAPSPTNTATSVPAVSEETEPVSKDIVILFTSDVHSGIDSG